MQLNTLFNRVETLQNTVSEFRGKSTQLQQAMEQEISKNRTYEATLNEEMNELNRSLSALENEAQLIDERNAFLIKFVIATI